MTHDRSFAIAAYKQAAVQMHPLVAVVRLYDEALGRIRKAIDDTVERRVEEAYINISKASLILRGLSSNLRVDKGEELAATLKRTYIVNMIALHTSFGKPDAVDRYKAIIGGLTELRNAWAEVAGMPAVASGPSDKSSGGRKG